MGFVSMLSYFLPVIASTGSLFGRSLRAVVVELLDDASCILDDLLVSRGRILREGLDDAADAHLLQSASTLLVHAEVADREQSDAARRL